MGQTPIWRGDAGSVSAPEPRDDASWRGSLVGEARPIVAAIKDDTIGSAGVVVETSTRASKHAWALAPLKQVTLGKLYVASECVC
jgi:hypothetical protein